MALQRFPVIKLTGLLAILWGVILGLHAVPKSYAWLSTLRDLLGSLKGAITFAMVIVNGQWYKTDKQFLRTTCWFECNGGSFIAYRLASCKGTYSFEA